MQFFHWVGDHWFDLLQSFGIIAGMLFTAAALRLDEKTRRIANLIEITKEHRQIWAELYSRPELSRITDGSADLKEQPITVQEKLFVSFLILHLNSAYHAMKDGVFVIPEGMQLDIQMFFSRPIAKAVWDVMKVFQDAAFVQFVETCLAAPQPNR
jgi:hypothetical protein